MSSPIRISLEFTTGNLSASVDKAGAEIGSRLGTAIQQQLAKNTNLQSTLQKLGAGGSASGLNTLSTQTQTLTQRISNLTGTGGNQLQRFFQQLNNGGGQASSTINSIGTSMIKLSATFYALERVGGIIKSVAIDPFVDLTKAIINATENSRKFEYAISGVVGGLSRARQLNAALVAQSRNSPLSVGELRENAQLLGRTPALAVRLGLSNPNDAATEAARFGSLVGRLGSIDPQQGESGARIGITNALQGGEGLTSLRRRFGISPQTLANLAQVQLKDLKSNPALTLKAIEKFADIFVPPEAYERTSQLVSVRWQKLKDAVESSLAKIGDLGVFDSISTRLKSITDQMFDYFDSADFTRQAARISASLDRLIGNVARSGEHLLNSITGSPSDLSSVGGTVNTVANLLERVGRLSDNLPSAIDKIGPAVTAITSKLGAFMDAVIALGDAARDPAGYVKGQIGQSITSRTSMNANQATLDALKSAGIDPSLVGTRLYNPKVNAGDTAYREAMQNGDGFLSATGQGALQTLRQMTGADVQTFEELDFRKLPLDQRAIAQKLYAGAQQNGGQIDQSIYTQLRSAVTGLQTASGGQTLAPRADEGNIPATVRALIQREYQAPNFQALLQASQAGSSGLANLVERDQSPLERLKSLGDVFGNVQISKDDVVSFAELLHKVDDQFVQSKQILEQAIGEGDRQLQLGGANNQLSASVAELRKQKDRLVDNYRGAFDAIAQNKQEAVKDYGLALADAISSFPPEARVEIERAISDGTTSVAKKFEEVLGTPLGGARKAFGIGAASMERAQQMYGRNLRSSIDASQGAVDHGDVLSLPPTASFEQIRDLKRLTPDEGQRKLLADLQGHQTAEARDLLSRATSEFNQQPSETSLANLRAAQVSVAELQSKILELEHSLDPAAKAFEEFAAGARGALETHLGGAINDLLKGTGSLKDAFRGLVDDITQQFSNLLAKQLIQGLIGNAGVAGAGAGGSGVGAIGGLVGLAASFFMKDGGVLPGHFTPIKKFADGGVVNRPTLGWIGEVPGSEEAVIPLRGGKVPVQLMGAARGHSNGIVGVGRSSRADSPGAYGQGGSSQPVVHVNGGNTYIVHDEAEAFSRGFNKNVDKMVHLVEKTVTTGHVAKYIRNR